MEKVKVMRIINRFNLGGPTFNVAFLTKFMPERFETILVGGEKDASEDSSEFIVEQLGIKPTIVNGMKREISLSDDYRAYRELRKLIQKHRPQIVHTHASKAGTLGRLAAVHEGVPIVLHTFHGHVFHSYFRKLKTALFKNIERFLAKRSTRIIAISAVQKEEISVQHRICPPEKMEVVPLGFDLRKFCTDTSEKRTAFRKAWGVDEDTVVIAIVGRLVPIKNHVFFLNVIKALERKSDKNYKAFVVGDGESREGLLEHCKAIDLKYAWMRPPQEDEPVCFTSWIRAADTVCAGSDIICLTSLNEGTPVSLIEAQASGRPIVSTRVGGITDIVEEDKSAFLVEKTDLNGFVDYLTQLIDNPQLRNTMGQYAQEKTLEKFSYQRLANDMAALYDQLLLEHSTK